MGLNYYLKEKVLWNGALLLWIPFVGVNCEVPCMVMSHLLSLNLMVFYKNCQFKYCSKFGNTVICDQVLNLTLWNLQLPELRTAPVVCFNYSVLECGCHKTVLGSQHLWIFGLFGDLWNSLQCGITSCFAQSLWTCEVCLQTAKFICKGSYRLSGMQII